MADTLKNFAYGTVLTAPSPATSGTSLVLNSGQGANFAVGNAVCWPANVNPTSANAEIVRVTAVSTDTLTITRAQESTTAQSIAVGWQVQQGVTAALLAQYMADSVYDPAAISQQVVGTTATQTLTNKRITKRVVTYSANATSYSINTDSYDVVHITSQAATITSIATTGTPVDGDTLRISITGTATVSFTLASANFEASTVLLSTTTSGTSRLDMGFFWDSETSKWRQVAVA